MFREGRHAQLYRFGEDKLIPVRIRLRNRPSAAGTTFSQQTLEASTIVTDRPKPGLEQLKHGTEQHTGAFTCELTKEFMIYAPLYCDSDHFFRSSCSVLAEEPNFEKTLKKVSTSEDESGFG